MREARLFAAIAFTAREKQELAAVGRRLKECYAAARFPAPELLHITLHFFGQTPMDRLGGIEAALRQTAAAFRPFHMATGRAGAFGGRGSAVLWLGIGEGAEELKAVQAELERALAQHGFAPEGRAFRAHITLARDARFEGTPADAELPQVPLSARGLTLMESTQARGRLEYIPLLEIPFGARR